MAKFEELLIDDKISFREAGIDLIVNHRPEPAMVTPIAQKLRDDHIAVQTEFMERLLKQMKKRVYLFGN